MRKPNYIDMEEVLNRYWISRTDMQVLLPQLSYATLSVEFNSILKEMQENNEKYFNSRPILIPVDKVVKKYNINTNYILKQAERLKKTQIKKEL